MAEHLVEVYEKYVKTFAYSRAATSVRNDRP